MGPPPSTGKRPGSVRGSARGGDEAAMSDVSRDVGGLLDGWDEKFVYKVSQRVSTVLFWPQYLNPAGRVWCCGFPLFELQVDVSAPAGVKAAVFGCEEKGDRVVRWWVCFPLSSFEPAHACRF